MAALANLRITLATATRLSHDLRTNMAASASWRAPPAKSLLAYAVELQRRSRGTFGAPMPPLLDGIIALGFELHVSIDALIDFLAGGLGLDRGKA